jgi:hypothetical protein
MGFEPIASFLPRKRTTIVLHLRWSKERESDPLRTVLQTVVSPFDIPCVGTGLEIRTLGFHFVGVALFR